MQARHYSSLAQPFTALSIQQISLRPALAQTPGGAPATYDPRITFGPLTLPDPVNAYRSGGGAPGPAYWQNQADYELHADLDTAGKQLKATETIAYTNNSPDTLPGLWIKLEQNIYRKDSRSRLMDGGRGGRGGRGGAAPVTPEVTSTDGFVFDSVEVEANKKTAKAEYIVSDTRMQIRLAGHAHVWKFGT